MAFLQLSWPNDGYITARLPCGHVESSSENDPGFEEYQGRITSTHLEAALLRRVSRHDCLEYERRANAEPPF